MPDIKDIKGPVDLFDWAWILACLITAIVTALVIYFYLRLKKKPIASKLIPVVQLPAWEIAYQALALLEQEKLPEKRLYKEFFTRVADITRHYMENRFNIRAPHMSSEEFLYYLGITGHLNETQKTALTNFLNSCDMVKFAKYDPTQHEAQQNFDLAKRLVDDTRI